MGNDSNGVFRLSPQQAMIWTRQAGSAPLNVAAEVRLRGELHPDRLREAIAVVVSRHEILRTHFVTQPGLKIPFQSISENCDVAWEVSNLSEFDEEEQDRRIERMLRRETQSRFDLQRLPLVHAHCVGLAPDRTVLVLSLPAMLSDWPSLATMVEEIASAYAGAVATDHEEPLRYIQFSQWQTDTIESDDAAGSEARAFWSRQKEEGGAAFALPLENASAAEFRPEVVFAKVQGADLTALDLAVLKSGASEEIFLLAVWQTLLSRLSGQPRFTIQMFVEGREFDELKGALGAIGKFAPIPARFDGDFSFTDVVDRLKRTIPAFLQWQEYLVPGDGADSESAAAFECFAPWPLRQAGALTFSMGKRWACYEPFLLKLSVYRQEACLFVDLNFDASRVNSDTAGRWLDSLRVLLVAAAQQPYEPVTRLPLLTEAERLRFVEEWNRTAQDYPGDRCFHELFEAQVERTPDRPAVRFGHRQLTYRELNEQSNRLAHHLRGLNVETGQHVALCLDRGAEMITALLAILKAGCAYIPLSPDNPPARQAQQIASAAALITEAKLLGRIPEFKKPRICLDRDDSAWRGGSPANPATGTTPDHLAYIIFTSGSTGTPKGVAVRHRNLVNYASFIERQLDAKLAPGGLHFATVSTLTADLGNTCIFPALLSGGCVHVVAQDVSTDSALLAAYQQEFPIDVLKIVPSHLLAMLETAQGASILPRRVLITGGEALTPSLVRRIRELSPSCAILNHYGPTETTVGSLICPLEREDSLDAAIPIGRPIANTQVYILDAFRQPVPIGVAGELYVAGDGVAAGYLNQPELTRERFVENPFTPVTPGKMYRTGDLARYRADGNIEFLGRADDQVKVRGFRVELGEVEACLYRHPAVRQAIAIARRDARGELRLLAYAVARSGSPITSLELREYLSEQLPDYMVPAAVGLLFRLPLTPNGKIDRQSLPEPEQLKERVFLAPRNPTEEALANIWREVFRRDRIGVTDNFFEMGGHSLMATQVISRVREQFRIAMDMRVLFDGPTIEAMANAVLAAQSLPRMIDPGIIPISRDRYRRT